MKRRHMFNMTVVHAVLLFFVLVQIGPILLVFLNSFKTHREIVINPFSVPAVFSADNFRTAWKYGKFANGFKNSIILTGCTILIVLFCSTLAGYVLTGKRMRRTAPIMVYFMLAMTVPVQMFLFPLYSLFSKMGLLSNLYALAFIMAARQMPLSVFLMRTFFLKVPSDLEEAAKLDGAGTWAIIWRVMVPIISPALITVSVLVGLSSWNEYMLSSTFLQGEKNFTAVLGFLSLNGLESSNMGVMMAGASILILPILIFFVVVQKYFIDGLVSGAVKG